MRAVAYARYSSERQDETSISAQLRAIREYAAKHGIEIVGEYVDEARSALTDERPEFQKMFADLRDGVGVDYVLVHKIDRFARNRYDAAIYRRKLQEMGVRLIAVDQPTDDSPEGALLESLLEGLAEYYSRNLARETLKGLKEVAHAARHTGGVVPYGYSLDEEKRYVINPAEAEGVRLAFRLFLQGKSYTHICEALEAAGHRTRRGGPWNKNALHEMFRNPKYAGILVYNRAPRRVGGKRNWRRAKPESEQVIVDGGVPAIVSRKDWLEVQRIMDQRLRPRRTVPEPYLLTGKVKCGLCGSPCAGISKITRGKVYRYYECNRKKRLRACTLRPWPKEALESAVTQQLKQELASPEVLRAIARRLVELMKGERERTRERLKELEAALADTEARIQRLLQAIEEGVIPSDVARERMANLRDRKQALEAEYEKAGVRSSEVTEEMAVEYLSKLRDRDITEVIDSFLTSVTLYEDRCEVNLVCAWRGVGSVVLTWAHPRSPGMTKRFTAAWN